MRNFGGLPFVYCSLSLPLLTISHSSTWPCRPLTQATARQSCNSHGLSHGLARSPLSNRQQHQPHNQHWQNQQQHHAAYYSSDQPHGYASVDAVLFNPPYTAASTSLSSLSVVTASQLTGPSASSPASTIVAAVMRAPQAQQQASASPSPTASPSITSSSSSSYAVALPQPQPPPQSSATTGPNAGAGSGTKRRLPRAAATYPRMRATQACLTCRFRLTECDNARPACAACVRLESDCSYRKANHSA